MNRNVYKDLIENLPVAALFILENKIYLNKKGRSLTGFCETDFPTLKDWFVYAFPLLADQAYATYEKAKNENFPHSFRIEFTKKNGEKRMMDLCGSHVNDLEIWVMDDVTDRLLTEERYTVLFKHSTDAHFLFDESGIIDCNHAAIKILNAHSKEELLSFHPAFFSPEYQPDGMRSLDKNKLMDQIAREEGYHRFEWLHKKITGEEFFVEVTLNPVEVAGKRMLLVVWHDLTDIKDAQTKLELERGHNFHASKMAALGEMASGIAHEINNPLTVILNRVLQIKTQLKTDPPSVNEAIENSDKIIAIVNRISKIIKGLRNFARDGGKDNYEFYPLQKIVEETLDMCQARFLNHNVSFKLKVLPDESALKRELFCVPVQIEQVLINLLNNAFDAVLNKTPNWVELCLKVEDQCVWINVIDSGEGIPDHLKAKIMQPFFTTKEVGKGTGLGLSISKGIIETHNGEFYLDENSAHTNFVVKLPLILRDDL